MKRIFLLLMLFVMPVSSAFASGVFLPGDRLLLQTSVWTRHFNPQPDHTNNQDLINLEWHAPSSTRFAWQEDSAAVARAPWLRDVTWLAGAATFRNSFAQRSTYLYGGGRYDMYASGNTRVYAKVTAGLLHGYRGEYRDKIPLNRLGVAPAVLPAVGVEHRRMNVEMVPFGKSGVMFNVGFYLN
jgi:hypothetical protein